MDLSDDAAALAIPAGEDVIVTSDAMVAGVHFLPDDAPEDVAAKLLRVNLSDLAAMGARPFAYQLTTALPRDLPEDWLDRFAAGLAAEQQAFGAVLSGGDSVSAPAIMLNVTMMGLAPAGQALRRSGARLGDLVFASGTIGDAVLGLAALRGRLDDVDPATQAALIARLRRPEPRLALGQALRGVASAALDVSDGLVGDLLHISEASGVRVEIDAARVPLSEAARRAVAHDPQRLILAATGGDDYELAFAAPPEARDRVFAAGRAAGVAITEIGRVVAGVGVALLDAGGRAIPLESVGWRHF